jgi:flagellar motility protein MotE (MotC chaperone)
MLSRKARRGLPPTEGVARAKAARHGLPRGQRVALVIVGLLIASAAIRIGDGISRAIAETAKDAAETTQEPKTCEPVDAPALIEALSAREAALDARAAELDAREATLDLAGERIDAKLAELAQAEEALSRTLTLAETAAEGDVAQLVSVYESMKPKEAAPLFEEMDPDFAAGFLGRMRPDAAAAILAGLEPKTAYTISAILAGRNANAPSQ